LRPPEGVSARIHQPPLPLLDGTRIQSIIDEGISKNNLGAKYVVFLLLGTFVSTVIV
jgi:hypothetical protein